MESLSYFELAVYFEAASSDSEVLLLCDLSHRDLGRRAGVRLISLPWIFIAVAVLSFTLTNSALALKQGDRGSEVTRLQQQLAAEGYFKGPVTGYYGPITQGAVIQFQRSNGLQPDGIVGRNTRAALTEPTAEPATGDRDDPSVTPSTTSTRSGDTGTGLLKVGQRSAAVKALQVELKAQGHFDGPTTGYYGPLTRSAVISFQRANNLTPDGIFGPQSRAALTGQAPSTATRDSSISGSNNSQPANGSNSIYTFSNDAWLETDGQTLAQPSQMRLVKTITGDLSPKSIVHSGDGLFFAQNMMYTHTVSVYNRDYELVKTIDDTIELSKYGHDQYSGLHRGAPVEAAFSHGGRQAWVSNYKMSGSGFGNPGDDDCTPSQRPDNSFLYRIDTTTLAISNVIEVGAVPKYVAATSDSRLVLASNWCSDDVSIVDTAQNKEIRRVKLGRYPRGIAIDPTGQTAYIAVMGSYDIARVDLKDFSVGWLRNVGQSPRHLNIDPNGRFLYASLNGDDRVAKIDLQENRIVSKAATGDAPRSMVLSDDGQWLYVVNYHSNTLSKVRAGTMRVVQTVNVNANPIGVTYDPETKRVWVACYSGSIMVFDG
ncbi:MAG: beta-propeller fold lactonase family protein [Spirulinaceae cyanobacterium SM2_1_0]|nr:beta-propeller fold lactonase family protein [Spirulinaceae cyanobacterium SM2_1_0]